LSALSASPEAFPLPSPQVLALQYSSPSRSTPHATSALGRYRPLPSPPWSQPLAHSLICSLA
jgi:hypothetical protein